ncbi:hypothetical protein [Sorangium sp. So ce1389]|uniref:hypothetical protein n=1 Tax=Sorangium sp. So ce1389 TaxID=3133336 RepID=UPI003F5FE81C
MSKARQSGPCAALKLAAAVCACLAAAFGCERSSEATSLLDVFEPVVTERRTGMGWFDRSINDWAEWRMVAHDECSASQRITGFYTGEKADGGFVLICVVAGGEVHEVTREDLRQADAELGSPHVGGAHWVDAARAAQKMCSKMGRLAGFFTGRQRQDRYELACLGLDVQRFYVERSEVGDLRKLAWDEAGPTADRLCRARGNGSGFFSGRELGEEYELLCVP